jgi:peroxiredoxin
MPNEAGRSKRMRMLLRAFAAVVFAACILKTSAAFSQTVKTAPSQDDLFRKTGITKSGGGRAPDFTLKDVNGGSVSLGRFRGKVVFLNFWATWCGPCRSEMASMQRLYNQLESGGLVMLAVNQKENRNPVAKFMKDFGLSFPALLDRDGRVAALYGSWGLPTTYVIDASGRKVGMRSGAKDWAGPDVVEFFTRLLGNHGGSAPDTGGSMALGPAEAIATALRVKSNGSPVRSQQDPDSELLAKLERGEDLVTLGKAGGWYMVRTKAGVVGWIAEADVEDPAKAK